MINSKDRAFYIGASDSSMVVGNWKTKTFEKWWMQKLGLNKDSVSTEAMKVGTAFEHKILDSLGCNKDKQIILEDLGLRVNYDGDLGNHIYEVKTYSKDEFKVSKQYWRQAQVEMFAWAEECGVIPEFDIVAYKVTESDYSNFFNPIDKSRLELFHIDYDPNFIQGEYLPKLMHLHKCIQEGRMP